MDKTFIKLCGAFRSAVHAAQISWAARSFEPIKLKGTLFNDHNIYATEDDLRKNFDQLSGETRSFFRQHGYHPAEAALDIVLREKEGKLRRDGKTQDALHELRQVALTYNFIKSGLISKDFEKEFSADLEILFLANLMHDVGEDFNIYRDEVVERLETTMLRLKGSITEQDRSMINRAADIMELMTHERVYKNKDGLTAEDQIRQQFNLGENLELPSIVDFIEDGVPNKNKAVRIPEMENRVREKMQDVKYSKDTLQVYAMVDKKWDGKEHPKLVYVVTRHGISDGVGTCWDSYISDLFEDELALFAKYVDRIDGLATRVGVGKFSDDNYLSYLRKTYNLFGIVNTTEAAKLLKPSMVKAFDAADSTMGVLLKIGWLYANTKKTINPSGSRGFDPHNLKSKFKKLSHHEIPKLNFSAYFGRQLPKMDDIPRAFSPLYTMMTRLNTEAQADQRAAAVYETVRDSLSIEAKSRGLRCFNQMLNSLNPIPS